MTDDRIRSFHLLINPSHGNISWVVFKDVNGLTYLNALLPNTSIPSIMKDVLEAYEGCSIDFDS